MLALYNWLNFKARPLKLEDFKNFVATLKSSDLPNPEDEWRHYADNLILAIERGFLHTRYCIDFQLLIRIGNLIRLCLKATDQGYQVAANITAVRLNAILTQPILLPPRLLKGRCSENCKTPNKMLLPTVKPDAVIAGRNPCACACDESCQKPSNFCICVKPYIDYMDVMVGTTRENEASTRAFLGSFTTLPLDSRIYEKAVTLRKEYWMRLPDAVICATARVHKLTLFTRDSKDFPVTDQDITVPYRL